MAVMKNVFIYNVMIVTIIFSFRFSSVGTFYGINALLPKTIRVYFSHLQHTKAIFNEHCFIYINFFLDIYCSKKLIPTRDTMYTCNTWITEIICFIHYISICSRYTYVIIYNQFSSTQTNC